MRPSRGSSWSTKTFPAVFDPEEAVAEGAPQLHGDSPEQHRGAHPHRQRRHGPGDGRGVSRAGGPFDTQRVHQCYAEPYRCVVDWDVTAGSPSTRGRWRLGLADHAFPRVDSSCRPGQRHPGHTGGSFGSKVVLNSIYPASAVLSRITGRPVKMVYSREEEYFAAVPVSPAATT